MTVTVDDAAKAAVAGHRNGYQSNQPGLLDKLLKRARKDYVDNAPEWNFVQGNLRDENKNLRSRNKVLTWGYVIFTVLAFAAIAFVLRPHYINTMVDAQGRPVVVKHDSTELGTAADAEYENRLFEILRALFSSSVQPSINRANDDVLKSFTTDTSYKEIAAYHEADNGANDPYKLASQGIYVDVAIDPTKVHKVGDSWIVDVTQTYTDTLGHVLKVVPNGATVELTSDKRRSKVNLNPFGVTISEIKIGSTGVAP